MSERRHPRILFVSHTSSRSGAESVLMHLAAAALAGGHAVAVASPCGPIVDELPADLEHVEIPSLGLRGGSGVRRVVALIALSAQWIRAARVLRGYLREHEDTRVVVNSLFALPAARVAGVPNGFTWLVHDTMVEPKQGLVVRFATPAVRRAVAVSSATAKPLADFGFPVVVEPNGVRIPDHVVSPVHQGRPVVGVLAKLTPWKGHLSLLEAAAQVPEVDVELAGDWFPGEEGYVAELHRRANAVDLRGRVRFLGRVDATTCLARWTAMISPSIRPEAGPLGVLEAMSIGCPVIGTDHGGTAEYLGDGAGLLVPPDEPDALADAIRRVIGDDELRMQLAARARERAVQSHDITATIPRMLRALVDD